jgi:hypothetical protein
MNYLYHLTRKNSTKIGRKIELFLKIVFAYIGISSLIIFPSFILEEAIQTTIFSVWPSQDVGQWRTVATGCSLMENINRSLKIVTYSVGWINPLAFMSYRAYGQATDQYITALRSKVAFHAPEMLAGKRISLMVQVRRIEPLGDSRGYRIQTNNLNIFVDEIPNQQRIQVNGMVQVRDGQAVVDLRKEACNVRR